MERATGIEPAKSTLATLCLSTRPHPLMFGRGDRSRTYNLNIQSVALRQLSHSPKSLAGKAGVGPATCRSRGDRSTSCATSQLQRLTREDSNLYTLAGDTVNSRGQFRLWLLVNKLLSPNARRPDPLFWTGPLQFYSLYAIKNLSETLVRTAITLRGLCRRWSKCCGME